MRQEVLDAARAMARLGLTVGTAGNVSGRAGGGMVVITPSALPYDAMTVDDLVAVDLDGAVVSGTRKPSGELALHLAMYRAFPDVGGVVHAHPVYATAFACARRPVPAAVDEFALYVGGDVPCAEYAPSGSDALAANAVAALRDGARAALLASHGLVALGSSPDDALHVATVVERGAHSIWAATALGGAVRVPPA